MNNSGKASIKLAVVNDIKIFLLRIKKCLLNRKHFVDVEQKFYASAKAAKSRSTTLAWFTILAPVFINDRKSPQILLSLCVFEI